MERIAPIFAKDFADAQVFCIGLKLLAKKCNMIGVEPNILGQSSYKFKDGSEIELTKAHVEAGLINNKNTK